MFLSIENKSVVRKLARGNFPAGKMKYICKFNKEMISDWIRIGKSNNLTSYVFSCGH